MLGLVPTRGAMIVDVPLKEACVSHLSIKRCAYRKRDQFQC